VFGTVAPVAVPVDMDGQAYLVTMEQPPGPLACTWAAADDWRPLFPGHLPDDQRAWWQERLEDPDDVLDYMALRPVAFAVAEQVYGMPWWAAHRILLEVAEEHLAWTVWCVRRGFDPEREDARRILASAVAYRVERMDGPAEVKGWSTRMFMPPPGVKARG